MKVAVLSGGVGGARLARGFEALADVDTSVIVNVGDDETVYGLHVSPDLDTVVYTVAGLQGPHGWGRLDDSTTVMNELARFGVDTAFTIGDLDLALNLYRTEALRSGHSLADVTERIAQSFGLRMRILPVTNNTLRTEVHLSSIGQWLDFQTYFVRRSHRDPVNDVRFAGAKSASPAPGVIEALESADRVVIAPSNPILSVWPILAVPGIEDALRSHRFVIAVNPLIGGRAVKGPTVEVLTGLGFTADLTGVLSAYRGIVDAIVIDERDEAADVDLPALHTNTMLDTPERSRELAREIAQWH